MEMLHPIETWFLVLSLFLPRWALLIGWISHQIPYNTIPFVADAIMAILVPRVLIIIYIYTCLGISAWFWIHLIVALFLMVTIKQKTTSQNS